MESAESSPVHAFSWGDPTLLLWGDGKGMATLLADLRALRLGDCQAVVIGDAGACVAVRMGRQTMLSAAAPALRLECSPQTVAEAEHLIGVLADRPGHQYLDVGGDAEQIMISRDEYPADLQ